MSPTNPFYLKVKDDSLPQIKKRLEVIKTQISELIEPIMRTYQSYHLLHLRLEGADRIIITFQELQESFSKLEKMEIVVNGRPHKLPACKKWGIIFLGKDETVKAAKKLL